MSTGTFRLSIRAKLSLSETAAAVSHFSALLSALSEQVVSTTDVDWDVDTLAVGSLAIGARPIAVGEAARDQLDSEYLAAARRLQHYPPDGACASAADEQMARLSHLLADRPSGLRFETASGIVTIGDPSLWPADEPDIAPTESLGSIEGEVQTLRSRNRLQFTIYDALTGSAVQCSLAKGQQEKMRDIWGKRASVSGLVKRDGTTGRPTEVHSITEFREIELVPPGTYREARGALPGDGDTPLAEDVLRMLRDAE